MTATISLFIAAAATGAFVRWGASLALPFPWSTFSVNIVGSLLIGFLFVFMDRFSPSMRTVVLLAFLGSLTTFSSFALDCLRLIQESQWKMLTSYIVLSNGLCILGCIAGWQLAKRVL